jgi:hypothetical protein
MNSLPLQPSKISVTPLGLLLPNRVSSKLEPRTQTTPLNVSWPTEPLPSAVPAARFTVTAPVEFQYRIRVLPLPTMLSLPPMPSNSLKVPLLPTLLTDGLRLPAAPKPVAL